MIAYEPIWAIGTGKVATTEQAEEARAAIRKCIGEIYDEATAEAIRIQYGGLCLLHLLRSYAGAAGYRRRDQKGVAKPDFGQIVNYNNSQTTR